MELVTIPPEFALLFFIPVIGFGLSLKKGYDVSLTVAAYLISQIGLCILARYIYG